MGKLFGCLKYGSEALEHAYFQTLNTADMTTSDRALIFLKRSIGYSLAIVRQLNTA